MGIVLAMVSTSGPVGPHSDARQVVCTALLELAFLAPELVVKIVGGGQPVTLSTARLVRDAVVPTSWAAQRLKFGT